MAAPRPPPLGGPGGGGSAAVPAVGAPAGVSMRMFHGEVFLGEVDVFPMKKAPDDWLPFPSNEIRVSHLSPPSERCPPLAILHTIAPYSVRCKLQAKPIPPHPSLQRLHLACFNEFKSAVVVVGNEELHLVAMPSRAEKVPCFWVCSAPAGLYAASVGMLNRRCLAIVFDLDETLIVANTMKSFEDRIEMLSRRMETEDDSVRMAGMAEMFRRRFRMRRPWHAFFGTAGSNNDINVLNRSPLFIDTLRGEAPKVQYTVNGKQYNTGYYLADGIYPEWAVFVKTIAGPQSEKDKLFARHQEGARKDVECAFGVLQSRFNIVTRPARMWKRRDVVNIMQVCVILHNMIVEDEKDLARVPLDINEIPGSSIALPPEVSTTANPCFAQVLQRNAAIQARSTHVELKNDLVEHIWNRYGTH